MRHGRGDHLLLLALVQGVELAVGAEDEDAMDAGADEAIEEPFQTRQVQVFVGLHRRGHGGDDAVDTHGDLQSGFGASNPRSRHAAEKGMVQQRGTHA